MVVDHANSLVEEVKTNLDGSLVAKLTHPPERQLLLADVTDKFGDALPSYN